MTTITISWPNTDLPSVNDVLKLPFGSYILLEETDNQLLKKHALHLSTLQIQHSIPHAIITTQARPPLSHKCPQTERTDTHISIHMRFPPTKPHLCLPFHHDLTTDFITIRFSNVAHLIDKSATWTQWLVDIFMLRKTRVKLCGCTRELHSFPLTLNDLSYFLLKGWWFPNWEDLPPASPITRNTWDTQWPSQSLSAHTHYQTPLQARQSLKRPRSRFPVVPIPWCKQHRERAVRGHEPTLWGISPLRPRRK